MILESRIIRKRRQELNELSLWEKVKRLFKRKRKFVEPKEYTDDDFRREFTL